MNLREQILATEDIRHEDVQVPEWGVTVRVRALPGNLMEAWAQAHVDAQGKPRDSRDRMLRIFLLCIVDPETGEPIFTEADLPALEKKCASAIGALTGVALGLNGGRAKN